MGDKDVEIGTSDVSYEPLILSSEQGSNKTAIRKRVWDHLDDNRMLLFPRPPYKQIPNFKGFEGAIKQLRDVDAYKNATNVLVGLDRILRDARVDAVQSSKTLFVTTSRIPSGILCKITPPDDASRYTLVQCANMIFKEFREVVGFDDKIHVDVMIVTSIAASSSGLRVGRDDDLADFEFSILASLGFVSDATVVITVVHDHQVVDLNAAAFGPHDLPTDIIVTPSRIIECTKRSKPTGITWSSLTSTHLEHIPVMKQLRFREWKAGKNVCLIGETKNPEELVEEEIPLAKETTRERERGGGGRKKKSSSYGKEKSASDGEGESHNDRHDGKKEEEKSKDRSPRHRNDTQRKRNKSNRGKEGGYEEDDQDEQHERRPRQYGRQMRRRPFMPQRNRFRSKDNLPALYIGGLPKNLKANDLMEEFEKYGITPHRIVKLFFTAYGFLIFETKEQAMDALKALDGVQIGEKSIKVELARRTQDREKASGSGDGNEEDANEEESKMRNSSSATNGLLKSQPADVEQ